MGKSVFSDMGTKKETDIFDLSASKEEGKFVKDALLLESEVASDIIEEMNGFPWLGALIKLGRVGKGFLDLRFIWKIGRFLNQSADIDQKTKEVFLAKLNKKDRKKMYEYLMHLLYTAEEDRKADVMGMVYRDRIMNNINNDMFLRLCSSINKVYIDDVDRLVDYVKPKFKSDYITNNLYSSGLLQMRNAEVKGTGLNLGGEFELNEVGKHLLRILEQSRCLHKATS